VLVSGLERGVGSEKLAPARGIRHASTCWGPEERKVGTSRPTLTSFQRIVDQESLHRGRRKIERRLNLQGEEESNDA